MEAGQPGSGAAVECVAPKHAKDKAMQRGGGGKSPQGLPAATRRVKRLMARVKCRCKQASLKKSMKVLVAGRTRPGSARICKLCSQGRKPLASPAAGNAPALPSGEPAQQTGRCARPGPHRWRAGGPRPPGARAPRPAGGWARGHPGAVPPTTRAVPRTAGGSARAHRPGAVDASYCLSTSSMTPLKTTMEQPMRGP